MYSRIMVSGGVVVKREWNHAEVSSAALWEAGRFSMHRGAAVADKRRLPDMVHGDERIVWRESGFQRSREIRAFLAGYKGAIRGQS